MSYYRRKPLTTRIHETKLTVHSSDCWFSFNSNNIAPSFLAYCGTQVFSVSSFSIWFFSEPQHACRYPATLTISWLCVALTYIHGQVSCEIMTKSCNPFSLVHTYIEISCHISEKEIFFFFPICPVFRRVWLTAPWTRQDPCLLCTLWGHPSPVHRRPLKAPR